MTEEKGFRDRLREGPHEDMTALIYEPKFRLEISRRGFDHQMWIHGAYLVMLETSGIVDTAMASSIARRLLEVTLAQIEEARAGIVYEDLYSCVEHVIIREVGPAAGALHTGRSRNDLARTHHRMMLKDALLAVFQAVLELAETLLERGVEHALTVMPGYTHWKQAQAMTLGYYLVGVASAISRDMRRLEAAFTSVDMCPLGASGLTGTGFPVDRELLRILLGFGGMLEHSYDAVCSRDDVLESLAALQSLVILMKRMAQDLLTWSTDEYAYVEVSDAYAGVSSIMPQKKNPDSLAKVRSLAGEVVGCLSEVAFNMGGTPFDDEEEAVTHVNAAVYQAAEAAAAAVRLLGGVVRTLSVDSARMLAEAENGFCTMTELADSIVRETGLTFRDAHRVVGRAVTEVINLGQGARGITADLLNRVATDTLGSPLRLGVDVVARALNPRENVLVRRSLGGCSPEETRRMALGLKASFEASRERCETARMRIEQARGDSYSRLTALAGS